MKFGIHNPSWVYGLDPAEAFEAVKAKAQWAEDHGFAWSCRSCKIAASTSATTAPAPCARNCSPARRCCRRATRPPRTAGRLATVSETIQLPQQGDRLSSSAPVSTDTPDFWPGPASESGPQLLAQ